jgi:hypothetical protein
MALDSIIVAATAIAPADRLTMAEFAQELRAWLAPPVAPATRALPDLSAMASAVREARKIASARASRVEQIGLEVMRSVEEGSKLLAPLREALETLGADIAVNQSSSSNSPDHIGHLLRHQPESLRNSGEAYATNCFVISTFTNGVSEVCLHTFFGGFAVGEVLHLAAGHALVRYDQRQWGVTSCVVFDRAEVVRSGSLRVPEVVRGLADDVRATVRDAAELYIARLTDLVRTRSSV